MATFDPSTIGLLRAQHGQYDCHVPGNTYSWDPSTNGCDATPDPSGYTCPISVNDSGCPDHLRVIADDPTPYTCPVSGIRVARRRISYYVVDDNENVVPNVQVGEALSPTTTNTCGNGYPSATPCSLYPSARSLTHCRSITAEEVQAPAGSA